MSDLVSGFFLDYAGVPAADIDLIAASAQASAATGAPSNVPLMGGKPCQAIRCGIAGNLYVTAERGGAPVRLRFTAGETQRVACTSIKTASSTAGDLTVFWDY